MRILSRHSLQQQRQQQRQQQPPPSSGPLVSNRSADSSSRLNFGASVGSSEQVSGSSSVVVAVIGASDPPLTSLHVGESRLSLVDRTSVIITKSLDPSRPGSRPHLPALAALHGRVSAPLSPPVCRSSPAPPPASSHLSGKEDGE